MKRAFFLNIIFLILANLLIKPFYLLWVEVEVNNIVGPAAYGTYAGIFSLCFIFQIIADPGLLNYNTTQIASDREKVFDRVKLMLGLKSFLAIIYILFVAFVAYISGYQDEQWIFLPWIMGNVLLISYNLYLRSNITAIGKYKWDSLFSILDKTLMIIILMYMIHVFVGRESFTILDFIKGQFLAYALCTISLLTFLGFQKISIIPKFDFGAFRGILKESLPFAWLLFLMTIYTRVDSFMLERLIPDNGYEAGVYASGFRLFDAGNSFAYLFAVLLLPIFSTMLAQKESIKGLLRASSGFLFAGIIAVSIFFCFWSKEIMQFFYPADYTESYATVFIWLMLALIPMSLAYISGSLLTADGRLKVLNIMAVIGVIVNVILNYIMIKLWQAEGAAIATTITQFCMLLIQIAYVLIFFNLKVSLLDFGKYLSYIVIVLGLGYSLYNYSTLESYLNVSIGIIISLCIALFLRLVHIDFFKSILKDKLSTSEK